MNDLKCPCCGCKAKDYARRFPKCQFSNSPRKSTYECKKCGNIFCDPEEMKEEVNIAQKEALLARIG